MQQLILIAGGLAIALGGLVAMFLTRPRPGGGPAPIADPYEELYSDLRGEVVARPLGERHAGVGRDGLHRGDAPSAAELDTLEFGAAHVSRGDVPAEDRPAGEPSART
jgi:hypothetical protein